jgi:ATP synthase protein I
MNRANGGNDEMRRSVRTRRDRRDRWDREGERSMAKNLAMIGSIGWLIVLPTLAGMFAGRWLDHNFGTGIFWSAALLVVGVSAGSYLAWKRIQEK